MPEGTVTANGITLWYETVGDPVDPALILINGLGGQGIGWPIAFCERLAAGGHYVIRFDNREVGLSQWFDADATYTYEDMADDVVGLLDALGIAKAHVVGVSMGGAIAQCVAIRHPTRVLSLTSISSSLYLATDTPPAGLQAPSVSVMDLVGGPVPETREGRVTKEVEQLWRPLWGDAPFDEAAVRAQVERSYDRAYRPEAVARQAAAGQRTPSRVAGLRRLTVPTLVIHGTADPLVPPDRGAATAALIPGARLLLIEGMGHCQPQGYGDELINAVLQHTAAPALAT